MRLPAGAWQYMCTVLTETEERDGQTGVSQPAGTGQGGKGPPSKSVDFGKGNRKHEAVLAGAQN